MSPLCYLLSALTVVFAVLCVMLRRKNKSFEGMLCKFMASFGFISLSIVGFATNPKDTYYFCMICFALFFGFFGDVLLGIKEIAPTFRGKLVPLGLLYFLVSHIFYICAFTSKVGFSIIHIAAAFGGALTAFMFVKIFKMKVDLKLRIALSAYYSLLIYKAAVAVHMLTAEVSALSVLALASSVLFVISDTVLAFIYFTPVKRKNVLVTIELSSYYPAQILAAMTLALI